MFLTPVVNFYSLQCVSHWFSDNLDDSWEQSALVRKAPVWNLSPARRWLLFLSSGWLNWPFYDSVSSTCCWNKAFAFGLMLREIKCLTTGQEILCVACVLGVHLPLLSRSQRCHLSLCEPREVGWRRLRRRKGGTHPAARTAGRKKIKRVCVCMCACRISNFLANLYTCCFDTSVFKSIMDGVLPLECAHQRGNPKSYTD